MTADDQGLAGVPADWYPDPLDPAGIRYWDGARWTVHTAPAPTAAPAFAPASTAVFASVATPAAATLTPATGTGTVSGSVSAASVAANGLPVAAISAGTSSSAPVPPPPAPRSRRRIVSLIVAAACLALLIGAGVVAAVVLNSGPRSATAAVRTYLDAIAAGDAEQANGLADPGVPEEDRSLLTDEVLQSADDRISVEGVRLLSQSATSATVEASLSLDGKAFTHRFTLSKGANDFLVLDTWQMRDALVFPVEFSPEGAGDVQLGEIGIPTATHWMYPASYTFRTPETPYFERGTQQLRLTSGTANTPPFVQPAQTPTPALADMVLAAVKDRVTACVTVPTNMDDACPAAARDTDLASFSVVSQPSGLASLAGDRFESESATIVTQPNEHSGYTPPLRKSTFSVAGTIRWQEGKPVFDFDAQ